MRRITVWLASTVSALVLLFSYHTSTGSAGSSSVVAAPETGVAGSSGSSGSSAEDSTASDTGSADGSTTSGSAGETYTGDAVSTRFGDVQVRITVVDGKVTAAEVTQVPWRDHKDQEINGYAVPILNEEAVASQNADIDMVSGATYTSEGYIGSLQSALDAAGLG